jgi:two-component system NtrC family response regulator
MRNETDDRPRLLVVEDQADLASQLRWALADEYEITLAPDGKVALDRAALQAPDLVTLDLGLPPDPAGTTEGLRVLGELVRRFPRIKVVVITGNATETPALDAIHAGACDYHRKPIDLDGLRTVLRRAAYVQRLERQNEVRAQAAELGHAFGSLLGASPPMRDVFRQIERVAPSSTTVLVTGESGSGKELVARAIHERSRRRAGPFVTINCAAIPGTLLESELFGHERGAYTGAHVRRLGKFELASGGTAFLDEIGDLELSLQAKLLRFLQDHCIERVGGRERIAVDVRVVAATNADLARLQGQGRFREDLYFRLGVVTLAVPPLRERGDDLLLLANAALRRVRADADAVRVLGFAPDALEAMKAHAWPGNVRELENRIQRAMLVTRARFLSAADLGLEPLTAPPITLRTARDATERRIVLEALTRTGGNISRAAREIGVTRPTFHGLLDKHGIRAEIFRPGAPAATGE